MMNFMQLFTTFLALNNRHDSPSSHGGFQNNHFNEPHNIQANMIKFPIHQEHFERFMKPDRQASQPPRFSTPINNELLRTLPNSRRFFDDRQTRTATDQSRTEQFRENVISGNDLRRTETGTAGILHRFGDNSNHMAFPVPITPVPDVFPSISPPVDIDAILAGLRVAENVPVRCNLKCGDGLVCPFGYLQDSCPRCQCAPDPCQINPCFSDFDTCVSVPNQNCIDENVEMCPFEPRCEEIGCGCPALWQPVCGTDKDLFVKTYVNNCAMTCNSGVEKIYDGECWPSHISQLFYITTPRPSRRQWQQQTATNTVRPQLRPNTTIAMTSPSQSRIIIVTSTTRQQLETTTVKPSVTPVVTTPEITPGLTNMATVPTVKKPITQKSQTSTTKMATKATAATIKTTSKPPLGSPDAMLAGEGDPGASLKDEMAAFDKLLFSLLKKRAMTTGK